MKQSNVETARGMCDHCTITMHYNHMQMLSQGPGYCDYFYKNAFIDVACLSSETGASPGNGAHERYKINLHISPTGSARDVSPFL